MLSKVSIPHSSQASYLNTEGPDSNYKICQLKLLIRYECNFNWENVTPEIDMRRCAPEKTLHSVGVVGTTEALSPLRVEVWCYGVMLLPQSTSNNSLQRAHNSSVKTAEFYSGMPSSYSQS